MDNSRKVLQAPADSSISGRIPSVNPTREGLLTQLLFAARDLARHQFTRHITSSEIVCVECRCIQSNIDFLEHEELCRTGRLMRVLASLLALPSYQFPTERSASRKGESEPASAAVEERPHSLPVLALCGEPWTVNELGEIRNAQSVLVVDPLGSELPFESELTYMRRIVDCVNTCAGLKVSREGGAQ